MRPFVAIDFDGTIAKEDIVDAMLEKFALPEWRRVEGLWDGGIIGSRDCLWQQARLIDASLEEICAFIDDFAVDPTFSDFVGFLSRHHYPFAVISDGFEIIGRRLLAKAGLGGVDIYSNELDEYEGKLEVKFPFANSQCGCGTCKRLVSSKFYPGLPVVLVGDGRSDFCLAREARLVFAKKKLLTYCRDNSLPHIRFDSFADVHECFLSSGVEKYLVNVADFKHLKC